MAAPRKSVRRQPPWRRTWRIFPYQSIKVDEKENPDVPAKGMLWIKVGQSMRNVRLWEDPMVERFITDDKEIVETIKLH